MHLDTYLDSYGSASVLARRLGVTPTSVSDWRSGKKAPGVIQCVEIELATDGDVRRWDLKPDSWHRIWPELIGTPGAPDVPQQEAAA